MDISFINARTKKRGGLIRINKTGRHVIPNRSHFGGVLSTPVAIDIAFAALVIEHLSNKCKTRRVVAFNVRIEGKRAMFARPEFRHDLVSYDLLTPHAARGILDSIYWRPGMTWVIETIRILAPIVHEKSMVDGRRVDGLCDVAYDVRARFDLDADAKEGTSGRHAAMFRRAAAAGQDIHLGRQDYGGRCSLVDVAETRESECATVVDHGWLLHSIAFHLDRRPRFFRARSVDGLVDVPEDESPLVYG